MSPRILFRATALALCLSIASAVAAAQVSTPHLTHSAPFVGQTLNLRIEGAVPSAPLTLFFSPLPGSSPTPWGLLELKRDHLQRIASGVTSATGTWSFDLSVPLDTTLAETQAHFQALVDDPSAPDGRVLSDAVHARLLGPRVYGGYRGLGSARTGLYIISAVSDSVVARVDYGPSSEGSGANDDGKPVFDAAFSRGAVMSTRRELLYFDPFFGTVLGRIPFAADCSRTLFTDSVRQSVFVLELGAAGTAKLHAIDLDTGAEIAQLDLPNAVEGKWCLDRLALSVFVAEFEPSGRTAIRQIGLDPLADLGSAPVGTMSSGGFDDMVYSAGQVFVSTKAGGMWPTANLTRCLVGASGITTDVTDLGFVWLYRLACVPVADRLLAAWMHTDFGPSGSVSHAPLSTSGPLTPLPTYPPTGAELFVKEIEADGSLAWFLANFEWQHGYTLYQLNLQTGAWIKHPFFWSFGPSDMEVLRDGWDHEVWVSNKAMPPPVNIHPEILVLDELHSTSRHIVLEHTAEVLHAVPLP